MNKIAVNGRCFSRRVTGVERYAHEISKRLIAPARFIQPSQPLGQISGHLWEQVILPIQLHRDEVLWSPANSGSWVIRRQAVTIQDASVFDHPEWFRASFAAWTRLSWKILARTTRCIITVSEFSSRRLKLHLGIPDHRMHIIPNCVGLPFRQTGLNKEKLYARFRLRQPYFLFVGTQEPRKNLGRLFKAWELVHASLPGFSLAIAGGTGTVFRGTGFQHIPVRTQLLGYVPTEDLPSLYEGATAVVIPSLYEGFCIPAIEAMACGAPLITSNTTSLPEVTGGAAMLVNPLDCEEVAHAMQTIVEDKSLASNLRTRGLQRAAQFTWEESARKTQSLLESL
jgi:glycosyltransferase involved in cell wall biosynthesis